jgi:hypothetical protein
LGHKLAGASGGDRSRHSKGRGVPPPEQVAFSNAALPGRFTVHQSAFVIHRSVFSGSRFSVHDANNDPRVVNREHRSMSGECLPAGPGHFLRPHTLGPKIWSRQDHQ